jgi:hypothetical protein
MKQLEISYENSNITLLVLHNLKHWMQKNYRAPQETLDSKNFSWHYSIYTL